MKDGICPKCESTDVATDVETRAGTPGFSTALLLETATNPEGWLSSVTKRPLLASVCGQCGYTEFYLHDPKEFVELVKRKPKLKLPRLDRR